MTESGPFQFWVEVETLLGGGWLRDADHPQPTYDHAYEWTYRYPHLASLGAVRLVPSPVQ